MKSTGKINFLVLLLLLLIGFFNMNFQFIIKSDYIKKPLIFMDGNECNMAYQKDSFDVQRKWIKISNVDMSRNLSAFVYYPVFSQYSQSLEVLPNLQWQTIHFEKIRKKVGDSLASIMINKTIRLSVIGELPKKKLPLIIFGPGLGWIPTDYTYLLASLASRGYVVVAITGIPISKQVYFPDNSFVNTEHVHADYQKMGSYFSLALSEIFKMYDKKKDVFSLIDTSKVIVMGHSISGAATLIAANSNRQIKGVINLDGDVNNKFKKIRPKQSILYITSQPLEASNANVETWHDDKNEVRRDNAFLNNTEHSIKSIRIKIPEMYHSDFLDVAQYKDQISMELNRKNYGNISFKRSSEIIIISIINFIENTVDWDSLENKYGIYIQVH